MTQTALNNVLTAFNDAKTGAWGNFVGFLLLLAAVGGCVGYTTHQEEGDGSSAAA